MNYTVKNVTHLFVKIKTIKMRLKNLRKIVLIGKQWLERFLMNLEHL